MECAKCISDIAEKYVNNHCRYRCHRFLTDLYVDKTIVKTKSCECKFHAGCIRLWYKKSNKCPSCNKELKLDMRLTPCFLIGVNYRGDPDFYYIEGYVDNYERNKQNDTKNEFYYLPNEYLNMMDEKINNK